MATSYLSVFVGGPAHGEEIPREMLGQASIETMPPPELPVFTDSVEPEEYVEFERHVYRREHHRLSFIEFDAYVHTGGATDFHWTEVLNTAPTVTR